MRDNWEEVWADSLSLGVLFSDKSLLENNKSENTNFTFDWWSCTKDVQYMSKAFCGWDDLEMLMLRSGTCCTYTISVNFSHDHHLLFSGPSRPDILQNQRTNWCDTILNRIPKWSLVWGVRNSLIKQTFSVVSSFKFYLSHIRLYRDCITSSEMWVKLFIIRCKIISTDPPLPLPLPTYTFFNKQPLCTSRNC